MKRSSYSSLVVTYIISADFPSDWGEQVSIAARLAEFPTAAAEALRKAASGGTIEKVSIEKDAISKLEQSALKKGKLGLGAS